MAPQVLTNDNEHAFVIRLNRPEKRNAIGSQVIAALDQALDALAGIGPAKPLVLRGSGEWFASGGDIREYADFSPEQAVAMAASMQAVLRRIDSLQRATVAVIDGPAIGGGAEMSLAFDLRVMSADAYIHFPQSHLGITTGWQGTERLSRLLGYSRAFDLLLTGRKVLAEEALELGLVNAVHPGDALEDALSTLTEALMESGQAGLETKRLLRQASASELSDGSDERHAFARLWSSDVHVASMHRFRRRNPHD